jgi:hypothetical protein
MGKLEKKINAWKGLYYSASGTLIAPSAFRNIKDKDKDKDKRYERA